VELREPVSLVIKCLVIKCLVIKCLVIKCLVIKRVDGDGLGMLNV